MTNPNWNPEDYKFEFPDVPRYEGSLINMPFIYKVEKVRYFVIDEILPEIVRAVIANSELAGMVLSLALVDYIAGYYVGKQSTGNDYIDFLNHYFPNTYKPYSYSIFHDLRNGLMHNLAAKNPWRPAATSFLIHHKPSQHLELTDEGRVLYSVPIFAEDIRRAWFMYMYDLVMKKNANPELVANFENRFRRLQGLGAYMVRILD
jgi:hypothetical protein